jgi:hypothetical protein
MATIRRDEDQEWAERKLILDQIYLEEQQILKALKRIDRARQRLLDAQNNLAMVMIGADDITRGAFGAFYRGGGITAEDWGDELETGKYRDADKANKIVRGQLRLIQSKQEGERKVRTPQTFDDNGPEAA